MNLLADESADAAIVVWLRSQSHDVTWAAETLAGWPDDELLALARREDRVLLTNDLDFGELVFRRRLVSAGVIVLRFRIATEAGRLAAFQSHWPRIETDLHGIFVVLRDRQIRRRRLAP